jgi:hypothetical protein
MTQKKRLMKNIKVSIAKIAKNNKLIDRKVYEKQWNLNSDDPSDKNGISRHCLILPCKQIARQQKKQTDRIVRAIKQK